MGQFRSTLRLGSNGTLLQDVPHGASGSLRQDVPLGVKQDTTARCPTWGQAGQFGRMFRLGSRWRLQQDVLTGYKWGQAGHVCGMSGLGSSGVLRQHVRLAESLRHVVNSDGKVLRLGSSGTPC